MRAAVITIPPRGRRRPSAVNHCRQPRPRRPAGGDRWPDGAPVSGGAGATSPRHRAPPSVTAIRVAGWPTAGLAGHGWPAGVCRLLAPVPGRAPSGLGLRLVPWRSPADVGKGLRSSPPGRHMGPSADSSILSRARLRTGATHRPNPPHSQRRDLAPTTRVPRPDPASGTAASGACQTAHGALPTTCAGPEAPAPAAENRGRSLRERGRGISGAAVRRMRSRRRRPVLRRRPKAVVSGRRVRDLVVSSAVPRPSSVLLQCRNRPGSGPVRRPAGAHLPGIARRRHSRRRG